MIEGVHRVVRVHADHVVAVSRRRDASVDPISDANGHIPHLPHLSPPNLCRKHQGKENVLLFPAAQQWVGCRDGNVRCKERLGGLLKYYHGEAA